MILGQYVGRGKGILGVCLLFGILSLALEVLCSAMVWHRIRALVVR